MILPLVINIRFAAIVTLVVTSILYFVWDLPLPYLLATLVASLFSTVDILMIVFGAVFLFEMMNASGYIENISQSIKGIHPSREIQFFIIAIGLTSFFEGVAGFGTPGAIVPLLLISMGFNPLLSVAAVLLFDGLFAAFGAVGTPLIAGLKTPLELTEAAIANTAIYSVWMLAAASIVVLVFILRMYKKAEGPLERKKHVVLLLGMAILPMILFAYLLPEFSTILASVSMLLLSVLYFTRGKTNINAKAWMPYLVLVILLLLPKLIAPLSSLLSWQFTFNAIFNTNIDAALKPLQSPLIPFVLVALLFTRQKSYYAKSLQTAGKKLVTVALLLFPIIAVAQMMLTSGVSQPSMINQVAEAFSHTGRGYVMLAPLIGITGAFVTGSTTLSNIVFGASHQFTAQLLSLDPAVVYAGQLSGASIGNAICLFNIIAACSVANIAAPNKVLMKNLLPCLVAGIVIGLISYILLQL